MNLLEAASTIATTADVEILFALYSQSRAYTNGKYVRKQIEASVNEIAALNGYAEEFSSFREFVKRYDNDTSPLWDFVFSDTFLVTDIEHPFPYSFEEFLILFRRNYETEGLVIIKSKGMPEVKYRLVKEGDGLRFIVKGLNHEAIVGGYDEDFVSRLPESFKERFFGTDRGFSPLRFSRDFYRMVDFYCHDKDKLEVYLPLTEEGLLQTISDEEWSDLGDYESETIYSTVFNPGEETLIFEYRVVNYLAWGPSEGSELGGGIYKAGSEVYDNYRPYLEMGNPFPYYPLGRGWRYAAYLFLIRQSLQIGAIDAFDFRDIDLPVPHEGNYACYDGGEGEFYVACNRPFREDELAFIIEVMKVEVIEEESFEDLYFYTLLSTEEEDEHDSK